jgi:hypothetical protein
MLEENVFFCRYKCCMAVSLNMTVGRHVYAVKNFCPYIPEQAPGHASFAASDAEWTWECQ